MRERLWKV